MRSQWIQSDQIRRRMQVVAQAIAWGGLLGMMLMALLHVSVARASILPPATPDFTLTGNAGSSQFGFAVAPAGDINGDGYADLLVGAPFERAIYIYAGSAEGFTYTAHFSSKSSQTGDWFGYSVDGGGDVNGDGYDDVVAGAYNGSIPGQAVAADGSAVGLAYVYHGVEDGKPSLAITLTGEVPGDHFGYAVALAGDVNGDGLTDVMVGALKYDNSRGRVYLYHGSPGGGIQPSPALTLTGEASGDGFGVSVDGAGDVNGDGYDDVVIGAWQNSEGGLNAGKVYVYFGSSEGIVAQNPFSVTGATESEFGAAVSGAGDVNGDGYADLLVGAYRADTTATDAGEAFLFWGSPSGPVIPAVPVSQGEAEGDQLGFAVSGAGDINGDGFDDLLAGAYLNDEIDNESGKAYGYSGCLGTVTPSAVFSATGEYADDRYGRAVTGIGDINGDGVDDIAIGAYGGKRVDGEHQVKVGKVFVYHGVKGGGCEPQIQMEVTLGLGPANPASCSAGNTLDVPVNTEIAACYRIHNSGAFTLTQHEMVDGIGHSLPAGTAIELAPGASYTHVVTYTPSADTSWSITWTAGVPIPAPGGAPTNPPGKLLTATAVATASVSLLPGPDPDPDPDPDEQPTIYLPLLLQ